MAAADEPAQVPAWEASVVERARAGDRAALRAIYEEHAPRIQRFLRDLLGDRSAASDATQETFARAFARLASLRELDRLVPWLFGIARLVALEHGKARRRERGTQVQVEELEITTPEDVLLGLEAQHVVGKALSGLSPDRRAALLLRIDHRLAYEDIAELLGWTVAKAKVEIHRARRVLRARLEAWAGEVP